MKSVGLIALTAALLSMVSAAAHAIEFKAVGANPVVLYDAPSEKGRKIFVAPRGMPVEVVLTYGEWTKVRDSSGDLFWIESKALVAKRNVIVNTASAKVHSAADDASSLVLTADKGVLLEFSEVAGAGWIKVRHRDGLSGYVKASEVWGE